MSTETQSSPGGWENWRVVAKQPQSSLITAFELEPMAPAQWRPFAPGQFLVLRAQLPGQAQPVLRHYSLCGAPDSADRPGRWRICVKREAEVSVHLYDAVQVGDVLQVQGPRGAFVLDESSSRPVLLLSGGVGLTPMVAMLHALAASERKAWFIHACDSAEVHALRDEVNTLAASRPGLHAHYLYRHAADEDLASGRCHSRGLITRELLQSLLPLDDYEAYLCGPPGFMQAVYSQLCSLGLARERIAYEFFGPATVLEEPAPDTPAAAPSTSDSGAGQGAATAETADASADTSTDGEPIVRFAASGQAHPWQPSSGNLLDFAESCGLQPDFSCRAGVCGSCSTRLISGQVSYVEEPLDTPADGHVLLCCARPEGPVELDL